MDDSELARLLRLGMAGDETAYAVFLERVAAILRGYCRRRTGPGGIEPEDVVQETLLAIHLKRHTWRQDELILPWIYAIVRYKLIDAFRRHGKRVEVDIADFAETLAEPTVEAPHERDVGRALEALSPVQRSVVASISVDGASIGETAAALGMNETAVRVALHRGLKAIARRFGKD